jgi:hypothetical protein
MTGLDIQKKLDSFNNLIQELGVSTFSSKEIWNRKKEIDENFRAAQFEQAEEKEKVTANFQLLVQLIHTKEKEVEQANEAFTVNAEELIASFEQNAKNILGKTTIEKEDFKTLRTQANEAFDYFKQQRWASKDRRTIAWDIYNLNRNLVKDREDEVMAKEREEKK